jgi:hypothetical protein
MGEAGVLTSLVSLIFFENKINGKSKGYVLIDAFEYRNYPNPKSIVRYVAIEFKDHLSAYTFKKLLEYRYC